MEILVGILVLIATCRADYSLLEVANKCGSTIDIDDSVEILYSGDPISGVCKITFETGDTFDNICVMSQEFNVDSRFRDVTVQYHGAYYSSFSPDKEYSRSSPPAGSWCSSFDTVIISFESSTRSRGEARIKLKVYKQTDGLASDIFDTAKTITYVIIGVVIGVIVLAVVIAIIVFFVCCRRRQSRPGQVYQPAATTAASAYPMQAGQQQPYPTNMQTGYQVPPPGGYPPAQYGNQPMPGYPPQQQFAPQQQYPGDYPPAQQGFAENQQTKPFIDPSAPPPPYTN